MLEHTHLRVVTGVEQVESPVTYQGPPASNRPGDRLEAVTATSSAAVQTVWTEALGVGIPGTLGLALVAEAFLVIQRLPDEGLAVTLDQGAECARVREPLAPGDGDYLQTLLGRNVGSWDRTQPTVIFVPVPMRLAGRVSEASARTAAEQVAVRRALMWERAALLRGQTMGEWAAWELLGRASV